MHRNPNHHEASHKHPASSATHTPFTFQHAVRVAREEDDGLSKAVQRLLGELTGSERLSLLDGDEPFYPGLRKILQDRYNRIPLIFGEVKRLGIPGVRFTDGPRGVVMGASTAFPVPMARGATWDVELEEKIGNAIGLEAKAQGANYFGGVCVNLPRHPAWGRIQETYSEDPLVLGELGLALTKGVQKHIMACVKHFALNSMENARFQVDVEVQEDVLHEVYLTHFRRIIEGGAASVMSSYNSVNGEFAGQNAKLLNDILRDQWKFDGFTITDFIFGLRDATLSVKNGLDIEAPFTQQRGLHLASALASKDLDWSYIDQSCARILKKQIQFAASSETTSNSPSRPPDSSTVVFSEQHRALARLAATRSLVLLKNDKLRGEEEALLPLSTGGKVGKVALIGRLANSPNTGDHGSSRVFAPHVVTPYEGLRSALGDANVILEDSDSIERAREIAAQVDVVLVIAGYDASDEGEYVVPSVQTNPALLALLPPANTSEDKETLAIMSGSTTYDNPSTLKPGSGGDRASLRLRPQDVDVINAVSTVNPKTIVSIISGGAVIMDEWRSNVPAIIMSWYSGCEGGHALADVLLGREHASGRLPFSIPTTEAHLPRYDMDASKITYDRWFGQALLDKLDVPAAFPLGYGLSYTAFALSDLRVLPYPEGDEERLQVTLQVTNTGQRKGSLVVQIYARTDLADFPTRILVGFAPVELEAGESEIKTINASLRPIQKYTEEGFVLRSNRVFIEGAQFAGDAQAVHTVVDL